MKTKHKHWAVLTASTLGLTGLAFTNELGGENYTYDESGNISEKMIDGRVVKMAYNQSNKVISATTLTESSLLITYNNAGLPISYHDASSPQTRYLSYGFADKIIELRSAEGKTKFLYNANGQLVAKFVKEKYTQFAWDGNVLAAEGVEAFCNEAHPSGGVPTLTGNQEVVVSDFIGNTLSHGDNQFAGSAYGDGKKQARFTGKPFIEEIGLYVFNHRYYSPDMCQWSYADPSGYPDGSNNQRYVKGDPLKNIDLLGLVSYPLLDDEIYVPTMEGEGEISLAEYKPGVADSTDDPTFSTGSQPCYRALANQGFSFEAKGNFSLPEEGQIEWPGTMIKPTIDSVSIDQLQSHEDWHRTHHQTLTDKAHGSLEWWSATYYGNPFNLSSEAMQTAKDDMEVARLLADTLYVDNMDRTVSHESASANWEARNYLDPVLGSVVRIQNTDWGGTLDASLSDLDIPEFLKSEGNCEQ